MPSFPLFISLEGKRVLVIGAGRVAARKIEKLMLFGPRIDVVAPSATDEVEAWARDGKLSLARRAYRAADLDGAELVIVAADDVALQQQVHHACVERKVPVNAVDSPSWCTFTFPALVVEGDATFGISTAGKAPGVAAGLRAWLQRTLPAGLAEVVRRAHAFRTAADAAGRPDAPHLAAQASLALVEAWAKGDPLPDPALPRA
ncbi:MAG: hypothetical protein A2138_05995 [Deltaproteobacteria bacterium RBG_16_71_12]|nr:MAG: hypothetical protein A2138_05995 [Deltaproteobacteria bacterium RBG_16_71_12]